MKVDVKLDRVTVTGKAIDGRQLLEFAGQNGWTVRQNIDGKVEAVLEREYENGDIENKAVLMPNPYQKDSWRVDTSNHLSGYEKKRVIVVSSQLGGAHLTRIDVAFDFINGDVPVMKHVVVRPRATQTEISSYESTSIFGGAGQLETLYSGKRSSDRMIRIYDKKRESEKHKKKLDLGIKRMERWEVQLRGKKTSEWLDSANEMLDCVKLPDLENADLNYKDKAVLCALNARQVSFADMSSRTRVKYHKLQKAGVGYDTHYADLAREELKKHIDDINGQLNEFLNGLEGE